MRFILLNVFRLVVLMLIVAAIRGLIGYAARALGFSAGKAGRDNSSGVSPSPQPGGELKKDPVCGTFVPASASVKTESGGQVLYFCSTGCRDKYRAS